MKYNENVDIVLATFNGEQYLSELLESILSQTHKSFNILISDDGSVDNTWDIVLEYAKRDQRIIPLDNNRKGGVIENFNNALGYSTSQYIMFSDQDDYWLPEKIEKMLSFIKKIEIGSEGNVVPTLTFSDLVVVDENLNVLSDSFYKSNRLNPLNNLKKNYLLWRSTVYGCSTIINKQLLDCAFPIPVSAPMHDQWLSLKARTSGNINYYPYATILYRQHANNVVGSHSISFSARLKRSGKNLKKIKNSVSSCVFQYKLINTNSELTALNRRLTFREKIYFIKINILPFFKEKIMYSVFFSYFLMVSK